MDNSDGRFDDPEESDDDDVEGPLRPYAPGADPDGDLPVVDCRPSASCASSQSTNPFEQLFAADDEEEQKAALSINLTASMPPDESSKKNKGKKKKKSKNRDAAAMPPGSSVDLGSVDLAALVDLDEDEGPLEEYRPGADPDGDLPELSKDDLLALGGSGGSLPGSGHGVANGEWIEQQGSQSRSPRGAASSEAPAASMARRRNPFAGALRRQRLRRQ